MKRLLAFALALTLFAAHKIFILTFLFLYSALAIALLGPWMYRRVRAFMEAHRRASRGIRGAKVLQDRHLR